MINSNLRPVNSLHFVEHFLSVCVYFSAVSFAASDSLLIVVVSELWTVNTGPKRRTDNRLCVGTDGVFLQV